MQNYQLNKKLKVYVVGTSTHYASFLNHELVKDLTSADLVLFTGGADINPARYNSKVGKFTHYDYERDEYEFEIANKAKSLGKPMWGTCRGIQLGCVFSGGMLVQHMTHPYSHDLRLYDGSIVKTNSLHHQLQHPYNLHPTKYTVAGYAKGLSNIYLNGDDDNMALPTSTYKSEPTVVKEAELVYYRETNFFGIQGHPEMLNFNSPLCILLRRMIDLQVSNTLDIVLTLNIPVERYLNKELELIPDELSLYDNIVNKRNLIEA